MREQEKLLYEVDTKFDHYQVVELIYEGRPARLLFSGDRKAAFSGMALDDNHELLFDYIQRLFELVSTIRPQRLLLIGGGTYTLPMALVQSLPDIIIDAIEIDPGLDDIAETFFGVTAHPRLQRIYTDGKSFLRSTKKTYDMIIIDAFSGLQIPRSLADDEAVNLLNQRLSPNGIVAMNIISSYQGRNAQSIEHFYQLYTQHFPKVTVYPADAYLSVWSSQNLILIADKQATDTKHGLRFEALGPLVL